MLLLLLSTATPAFAIDGTAGLNVLVPSTCAGLPGLLDDTAAIPDELYEAHGCGSKITVTGPEGTGQATVTQKCDGCKKGDIDLSPAAFNKIGGTREGRVKVTWSFL
ncbi:hypothetical protein Lesp02_10270 [Lentzea sp. NBRC 105346]|nr:hypothetical protein Lesp02_10270 [Lentzea sp. NBRC 105346]